MKCGTRSSRSPDHARPFGMEAAILCHVTKVRKSKKTRSRVVLLPVDFAKMLAFFRSILDWIKSLFWKEEMELTLVGLQYSGKTTFVNVIAVSVLDVWKLKLFMVNLNFVIICFVYLYLAIFLHCNVWKQFSQPLFIFHPVYVHKLSGKMRDFKLYCMRITWKSSCVRVLWHLNSNLYILFKKSLSLVYILKSNAS